MSIYEDIIMAGYYDLLNKFEELRKEIAIFRKVVLHSHSPDSHDYKPYDKSDKNIEEERFKEAIINSNFDMVAITDHMKCGFACRLSESTASSNKCVLPGMEINLRPTPPWNKFRLHIIAIFPERYSIEQVCKILPSNIPNEKNRSGREEIEGIELNNFIKTIHDYGGLCIAAHINTHRGVRRVFRQLGHDGIVFYDPTSNITEEEEKEISKEFKEWILSAGFDAIEVAKDIDKEHYRWISDIHGHKISIPVVLTNDAHIIEDLDLKEKTTYIKMTSNCFNGLKQALQFPDTRIRFPGDVPQTPSPRILGIEIIASDKKGFFQELRISLSENLTCLIGPRGSGKSTIIEALRYVFGYNRSLKILEYPGADLQKKVRDLQDNTLTNCIIRVVFLSNGNEPHILEATFDSKQDYVTRVFNENGEEIPVHDVEASGLYPLRLFGWSEIETLGRETHRQRELLDILIPELSERLEKREELRSKLKEKRKSMESSMYKLSKIINRNNGEIRRYKEYKSDFDKLNTKEVQELFSELDIAKAKDVLLNKLKANTKKLVDNISNISKQNILEGINDLLIETPEQVKTWWSEEKEELKLTDKNANVTTELTKGINILNKLLIELDSEIQQINEIIQVKETAIRENVSGEAAKQSAAGLRRTAGERLKRTKEYKREYNIEYNQFNTFLEEWKQITKMIVEIHDEISGKRAKRKKEIENRLNQFGSDEISISLHFNASHDRTDFENHFRDSGFLTRDLHGKYKAARLPEKISNTCTPVELAEAILTKRPGKLVREIPIGNNELLNKKEANLLIETLYPFGIDDDAEIKTVDNEKIIKILTMAEVEWDDDVGILLNNRPVEKLSPGQRSSAMLPLIALVDTTPLVIDQPEDNLDNKLVGKMLVEILADLKEKRQIIVATHNPNIVVSGDAEQVIVLDAKSDSEGICTTCGSIDKNEIVDSVIDILEGGKEAFQTRRRRYSLY